MPKPPPKAAVVYSVRTLCVFSRSNTGQMNDVTPIIMKQAMVSAQDIGYCLAAQVGAGFYTTHIGDSLSYLAQTASHPNYSRLIST